MQVTKFVNDHTQIVAAYDMHVADWFYNASSKYILNCEDNDCPTLVIDMSMSESKMIVDNDMIDVIDTMFILKGEATPKNFINHGIGIIDEFVLEDNYIGKPITCGYMQMMNCFYAIYKFINDNNNKNINVKIIDFGAGIHTLALKPMITYIKKIQRVKALYLATNDGTFWHEFTKHLTVSDIYTK